MSVLKPEPLGTYRLSVSLCIYKRDRNPAVMLHRVSACQARGLVKTGWGFQGVLLWGGGAFEPFTMIIHPRFSSVSTLFGSLR